MKSVFLSLGIAMAIIFGGGFLIRLIRDSDFYIVEFIVGIIGVIILFIGIFVRGESGGSNNGS